MDADEEQENVPALILGMFRSAKTRDELALSLMVALADKTVSRTVINDLYQQVLREKSWR